MIDNFIGMLTEQIWNPLFADNSIYTVGETILYASLFLFFVWILYTFFEKMKIKVDLRFVFGWSGWILLMAGMRVLEDQSVLTSRLFITPYIDILFAAIVFLVIFLLKYLENRKIIRFHTVWMRLPFILFIPVLFTLSFSNVKGVLTVLSIFIVFVLLFLRCRQLYVKFFTFENIAVLSAHFLDASATFVAIYFFGAFEKHVVPIYFIDMFGPAVMFPLKLIVISAALYYIDGNVEDKYDRRFFKLVIYSLGLGTGLRDMIQIGGYMV